MTRQAAPPEARHPSGHFDAVVVGARAAGAATAMLLARRGLRVLAIDKATYGSDTLSSHALMRGAVSRLQRWRLLGKVWEAGTPVITKTSFRYGPNVLEVDIPATDDIPGLAAPRRTVLDPILVDAAMSAGAVVCHETRLLRTDATGRVRDIQLRFADRSTGAISADLSAEPTVCIQLWRDSSTFLSHGAAPADRPTSCSTSRTWIFPPTRITGSTARAWVPG
jgi:hypothetical protein